MVRVGELKTTFTLEVRMMVSGFQHHPAPEFATDISLNAFLPICTHKEDSLKQGTGMD